MDFSLWNAVVSTATLLVVGAAALAALRQLRHLQAQTTFTGMLKVVGDWDSPEFRHVVSYVGSELQEKLREPGFLEEFDRPPLDHAKHPELVVADWYEQVGTFMKYGLLEERILMDLAASSTVTHWRALEPVIARIRRRRGPSAYENFEYFAARCALFVRRHPGGCYPRSTPRMAAIPEEGPVSESAFGAPPKAT